MAVAGGDEVRQERLGAVEDPVEVDAEDPLDVGPLEVDEVAGQRDAGVVDDDVDPAELRDDGLGVGLEGRAVGDVEAVRADLPGAGTLHEVHGLGQAGLVDVGEREKGALAGEVQGEGAADAGAGPGDDDDLVGQVLHACAASREGVVSSAAVSPVTV